MSRKSDAHSSSNSARASSYSIDDESFASNFEEKNFFSALYEFSQGLGPVQIWEYCNSNDSLMRFVVNTPPPDIVSSSGINYGERVTNILSKFEEYHYIALYSQVLDCQARGFTRSIVLVVAHQNPEVIKYVHEAYIDELTKIIDHIYKNSFKLFFNEIQGYSLSLLKTAEATDSPRLKSKFQELKTYLLNFGIDITKIIRDDEERQNKDQISSENKSSRNQESVFNIHGEIKTESFFTTIDNNLRSIRSITDFDYSILEDLQYLISILPTTDTDAAIAAHINVDSFIDFTSYKLYQSSKKIYDQIPLKATSDSSTEEVSFTNPETFSESHPLSRDSLVEKVTKNSSDNLTANKPLNLSKPPETSDHKSKKQRRQTGKDKDQPKKRSESIWPTKPTKKQLEQLRKQNRRYGIEYPFDLNFGGFKGRYGQLVMTILKTNYDTSLFTLHWLAKFKVFRYCAFTILSGGTLVIVTSWQDTLQGKLLADRFSLLAPFSLVRGHSSRARTASRKSDRNSGSDLDIKAVRHVGYDTVFDEDDDDENGDNEGEFFDQSEILLVKDSVEPRECFKYSIVVTNSIRSSPASSESGFDTELDRLSEKVRPFPYVTTYSRASERDESLLSILDLTTNVYRGDGCPDNSYVMNELGKVTSLHIHQPTSGGLSASSIANADSFISQQQPALSLKDEHAISSSSSSFSPVSKRRSKPSNKQTVNSPPSPLSMGHDLPVFDSGNDQHSPTQSFSQKLQPQQPPSPTDKKADLRNYSSAIITMSGSSSNTNLADPSNASSNEASASNQNSMLITDNDSMSEIYNDNDCEFPALNSAPKRSFFVGTYSGPKHGRRLTRPSFASSSDASYISSSNSVVVDNSESENLFVMNMYATVNRVAARFVEKLAELTFNVKKKKSAKSELALLSHDSLLKEIGFTADDEPILKYWIYCFFNKHKCRPVLFDNRSNVGFTVISMYK